MPVRSQIAVAALALIAASASAQQPAGSIEPDGTVAVPAFRLPPSIYLSDEARKALPRTPTDPEAPLRAAVAAGKAGEMRAQMPKLIGARLEPLKATYKVTTREGDLGGVPAVFATPAGAAANAGKILLNLPGGGFVMGVASGTGMIESIPLAGLARVEIVSITYRQGPEARYPAATEDAVKAYRALLKTHKPQDVAIFGCSAGGLLTAQTTAALIRANLPLPAAIGIFCASADAHRGGDSRTYANPFQALPSNAARPVYFEGADLDDPLASPILSPETLRRFPPTLIITSTRAADLSSAAATHGALVKAGVEAELHVWDGLGHAFFYNAALPESRDAFAVMATFFRRHLKLR